MQPTREHGGFRHLRWVTGELSEDHLGHILRELDIARLAQGCGVDQAQIFPDEGGKRGLIPVGKSLEQCSSRIHHNHRNADAAEHGYRTHFLKFASDAVEARGHWYRRLTGAWATGEQHLRAAWNACLIHGDPNGGSAGVGSNMRSQQFLEFLEQVHPGARAHFETGASWAWHDQPYQKGAFMVARAWDFAKYYESSRTAEGRLHFAGDHTSPWPGWVQGALHSGLRAAREVNESAS